MHRVMVKRDELIKRVQENRDQHRAIFEQAQVKYRDLVIEELNSMLRDAASGKEIRRSVKLIEPQDHTKEYDRVLDMLSMSVDTQIDLDAASFARLVRNEWEWMDQWSRSTASYVVA